MVGFWPNLYFHIRSKSVYSSTLHKLTLEQATKAQRGSRGTLVLNSALGKMRLTPDFSGSNTNIFTVLYKHSDVCNMNIMTSEFDL